MNCKIWSEEEANLLESAGDYDVLDSLRAGGAYWISGTASGQVLSLNSLAKRLLTTWLCEQRRAGVEIPKITSDVIELLKSRQPLPIVSRMTRALEYLGKKITQLGDRIAFGRQSAHHTMMLFAETESQSLQELQQIMSMLKETGAVEGAFFTEGGGSVRPTAQGWRELDSLRQPRSGSSQAFVAMWFNEKVDSAYTHGIAPALSAMGYQPVRIDQKEHNNKIDDEIIAEIRRSRFLVADFTCETGKVRGGVYYEAGFAQGLGIPVIWTCKDTSLADLHFDTRQYAHIVWKDVLDLYLQLRNRIGATIGEGPLPKTMKFEE